MKKNKNQKYLKKLLCQYLKANTQWHWELGRERL